MDVKISVIMPVYNGGTFLEESINSILAQTFTEFEFIVINDGSTDDTEKIVLGYNDERICYIKIPENKGIVFCLNHGLSLAKGVYIARMDADDIAEAARLSIQYEYLEKNKQVQIAGSYTRLFNKNGLNKIREYPVSPNAIKSRALKEVPFAHPAVMFRSALIKNGDYYYDPAFYPAEDYELWTRLILKYETANITVPLLRYRLHDKQISSLKRGSQLDINKILKRNYIRVFFALDKERRVNDCYLFYNESSKLGLKNLVSLFFFLAAKAAYIKNIQVLKFTSLVFLKSVYRRINVNRMLSGGIIFLTGF